jgi:hypothetical protein
MFNRDKSVKCRGEGGRFVRVRREEVRNGYPSMHPSLHSIYICGVWVRKRKRKKADLEREHEDASLSTTHHSLTNLPLLISEHPPRLFWRQKRGLVFTRRKYPYHLFPSSSSNSSSLSISPITKACSSFFFPCFPKTTFSRSSSPVSMGLPPRSPSSRSRS